MAPNKCFSRIYQKTMHMFMDKFLDMVQEVISGEGCSKKLAGIFKANNIDKILIITGPHIVKTDMFNDIKRSLEGEKLVCTIFSDIGAETDISGIEKARWLYDSNSCQAILAVGGGSAIDCAKGIAAGVARPEKRVDELFGYQKVHANIPLLIAVPTTAGTGSEATACAVIKDTKSGAKSIIADTNVYPKYAVLDPLLTVSMSQRLTAYTGMDAFTHAVEAYIGKYSGDEAKGYAFEALQLIFNNLSTAYNDGSNINARQNMLKASFLAGKAFTRTSVGYVHAIAHAIGGQYNIAHGMAVATALPYVLEWYGKSVKKNLSELDKIIEPALAEQNISDRAANFINYVKSLNKELAIPEKFDIVEDKDIEEIVKRAMREANPYYPVPRIMSENECIKLIYKMSDIV